MTMETFQTFDGHRLACHRWDCSNGARGAVVIIHGFGHHGASFEEVAQRLNAAGYAVYAFDQRGHGRSPGDRGYIGRFDDTILDMQLHLGHIQPQIGSMPVFFFGHSLGGLILACYCLRYQPAAHGLIFSSSALRIPDNVPKYLLVLSGVLGKYLPKLPVQKVDFASISRDPKAVDEALRDPLRYLGKMHARTGLETLRAIREIEGSLERFTYPLLICHGTADKLTDIEGSRRLYAAAESTDKTLRIYDGAYHEIWNDLDKDRFMAELIEWLDARS